MMIVNLDLFYILNVIECNEILLYFIMYTNIKIYTMYCIHILIIQFQSNNHHPEAADK